MPQGPDGKTIIIVKKVAGHGGHHGGSWKVAYADFVTSMMAFFMVLWLVNSASVQIRERIASYFRAPGVFEKGSGTPVELGGAGILQEAFAPPAESDSQVQPSDRIYEGGIKEGEKHEVFGEGGGEGDKLKGESADQGQSATKLISKEEGEFEKIAEEIRGMIEKDQQAIAGLIGKIDVKVDQRGLHLEIMDTPYASMFDRGSATIKREALTELTKIADIIKRLPNPVDIEGHTDATPFKGKIAERYDNWNLSADRANAARMMLKEAGMIDTQVARVVGYAAQRPKNTQNALDSSNRRISISMRYTEQAAETLKGTTAKTTQSVPIGFRRQQSQSKQPSSAPETTGSEQQPVEQGKLSVEIGVTQPEGTVIVDEATEVPTKPTWMDKDKIFGDQNPFEIR